MYHLPNSDGRTSLEKQCADDSVLYTWLCVWRLLFPQHSTVEFGLFCWDTLYHPHCPPCSLLWHLNTPHCSWLLPRIQEDC